MEYKFTFKVVKNIEANSLVEANRIAKNIVNNNFGGRLLSHEIRCSFVEIMNDTNAHNKRLVDLINFSYNYDDNRFFMIVNTLAKRDEEECEDKGINVPITDEDGLYEYLMHVADDEDLKVVIGFIRPRNSKGELLLYNE